MVSLLSSVTNLFSSVRLFVSPSEPSELPSSFRLAARSTKSCAGGNTSLQPSGRGLASR